MCGACLGRSSSPSGLHGDSHSSARPAADSGAHCWCRNTSAHRWQDNVLEVKCGAACNSSLMLCCVWKLSRPCFQSLGTPATYSGNLTSTMASMDESAGRILVLGASGVGKHTVLGLIRERETLLQGEAGHPVTLLLLGQNLPACPLAALWHPCFSCPAERGVSRRAV